jgi:LPXTG-motif cell wall-anchored protein
MKQTFNKQILLAVTLTMCALSFASAQLPATNTSVATGSRASSTEQTTVTANGDQLCTLSNGNKIPCQFKADAEVDIADGPAITNKATGQKLCSSETGVYLDCTMLNPDGTFKPEFQKIKNNIQLQKLLMQVKAGQFQNIFVIAGLALVLLVTSIVLARKKKKAPSVVSNTQ